MSRPAQRGGGLRRRKKNRSTNVKGIMPAIAKQIDDILVMLRNGLDTDNLRAVIEDVMAMLIDVALDAQVLEQRLALQNLCLAEWKHLLQKEVALSEHVDYCLGRENANNS